MPETFSLVDVLADAWNAGKENRPFDFRKHATDFLMLYEENRPLQEQEGQSLEVQGILTARGLPLVQIAFDPRGVSGGQFSPDEARAHASLVFEAASNATADAAVFLHLTQERGFTDEQAIAVIAGIRRWRADKWGQDPPTDWREK